VNIQDKQVVQLGGYSSYYQDEQCQLCACLQPGVVCFAHAQLRPSCQMIEALSDVYDRTVAVQTQHPCMHMACHFAAHSVLGFSFE